MKVVEKKSRKNKRKRRKRETRINRFWKAAEMRGYCRVTEKINQKQKRRPRGKVISVQLLADTAKGRPKDREKA